MLDPQLICYSWITGISDVAQVVFVRKRLVEIQYFRTTIAKNNARNSAVWSTTRFAVLRRPNSCRIAASGFRRTLAPTARMSASVWDNRNWSTPL
jgi:hypothetical protein